MANSRPRSFGTPIITSTPANDHDIALHLPSQQQHEHVESPVLTPTPSFDGIRTERNPSIVSPFYEHPPASHEALPSRPSTKQKMIESEKDLERGDLTPSTLQDENPFTSQISVDRNKECKMWPSRQTLMHTRQQQKKQRRANRTCASLRDRWSHLTKRQRLIFKIVTALFVIGVAVAIGVGISVAVDGGYYASDGNSPQIHS